MKVQLWFIRETEAARLYSKLPPEGNPGQDAQVWIPRSQIEHSTKFPDGRHVITIPDWLGDKKSL
jgi:hypothetical protein